MGYNAEFFARNGQRPIFSVLFNIIYIYVCVFLKIYFDRFIDTIICPPNQKFLVPYGRHLCFSLGPTHCSQSPQVRKIQKEKKK